LPEIAGRQALNSSMVGGGLRSRPSNGPDGRKEDADALSWQAAGQLCEPLGESVNGH
jgi:hypothetical protein